MKGFVITVTVVGALVVLGLIFFQLNISQESDINRVIQQDFTKKLTIQTPAFPPNGTIARRYTCDGEDISPRLLLGNIPLNAESVALIVDDADVPGEPWVHWLVWNINPSVSEIAENSIPLGAVEGVTSFGTAGYRGPCPPEDELHNYTFKIYALDSALSLPASSVKEDLLRAMVGHTIEDGVATGSYKRPKK